MTISSKLPSLSAALTAEEAKSQHNATHLLDLPVEILEEIFERLPLQDLKNLDLTSRACSALTPPSYKSYFGKQLPQNGTDSYKTLLRERAKTVCTYRDQPYGWTDLKSIDKFFLSLLAPRVSEYSSKPKILGRNVLEGLTYEEPGIWDDLVPHVSELLCLLMDCASDRGTANWNQAVAACLLLQGRDEDMGPYLNAVQQQLPELSEEGILVAAACPGENIHLLPLLEHVSQGNLTRVVQNAAWAGNVVLVDHLVQKNSALLSSDVFRSATRADQVGVLSYLIDVCGAEKVGMGAKAVPSLAAHAMCEAARFGSCSTLLHLLTHFPAAHREAAGGGVGRRSDFGTPFDHALVAGQVSAAKLLLEHDPALASAHNADLLLAHCPGIAKDAPASGNRKAMGEFLTELEKNCGFRATRGFWRHVSVRHH